MAEPDEPVEGDEADEDRPPDLSSYHVLGDDPVPEIVSLVADGRPVEFVWRSELGGLTFRTGDRYVKWYPKKSGIHLGAERDRLDWISKRHPAPRVVDYGSDELARWLVTEALPGGHAVGDPWTSRHREAIQAIATGLRAIHRIPVQDFPSVWTSEVWVGRTPTTLGTRPPVDDPVVVHGDACAPNTLISSSGEWTGNVDFGDLAVGDKWADLAVASMSLDWNFGEGHQLEFFEGYGIEPDEPRINYYRALWHLES